MTDKRNYSEESFVHSLVEKTGQSASFIGDDCAILTEFEPPLLLTTDTMTRNVHYDDHFPLADIGTKLAGINLSDIAAMGGRPRWALFNLTNQRPPDDIETLSEAVIARLKKSNTALVGGDFSSSSSTGQETLSLTLVGEAHPEGILRRTDAQAGDRVVVFGKLGGPASVIKHGETPRSRDDQKLLSHPPDQLELSGKLVEAGVKCGMDLSDGLLKDLKRICEASNVGATINPDQIPIHSRTKDLCPDKNEQLELALTGGEDFYLLATIPEYIEPNDLSVELYEVGTIKETKEITFEPELPFEIESVSSGYDHFEN